MSTEDQDKRAIDEVVKAFFESFDNTSGRARLHVLGGLCVEGARVTKAGGAPETLEAFIAPREALLASGRLTGFTERETGEKTEIVLDCAQRASRYRKSWTEGGRAMGGTGNKLFQMVRSAEGWRIVSVLWQDDPERGGGAEAGAATPRLGEAARIELEGGGRTEGGTHGLGAHGPGHEGMIHGEGARGSGVV